MESKPSTCAWCGRAVAENSLGRRRKYCRRSCRQRAYEQRQALAASDLPEDVVILTPGAAEAAADRAYQVRCASEDIQTAIEEGAEHAELAALCRDLVALAREAERFR